MVRKYKINKYKYEFRASGGENVGVWGGSGGYVPEDLARGGNLA